MSAGFDALPSAAALRARAAAVQGTTLADLFAADPQRGTRLTAQACGIHLDYAKQHVTAETLDLLRLAAEEAGLRERITAMFAGEHINRTEDRSVLHVALRAPVGAVIETDGEDVVPGVHEVLGRMGDFARRVRSGEWTGAGGQPVRNIVNIGIGGSHLGPEMAVLALEDHIREDLTLRFVSNVDGSDLVAKTSDLDPAQTLVVVVSKTFGTLETLENAKAARDWIVAALGEDAVARHMVAVSTNEQRVRDFGIDPANMFGFWDWVGGRYSVDSAVGLAIMLGIGPEAFGAFLGGMRAMDEHLLAAPWERNLPVLMGLIGVWNATLRGHDTLAVLPYEAALSRFPAYLQQLTMESNGKRVTDSGEPVGYGTAPILWGEPGTNGQHSFHQLLHQGTRVVPADIIGFSAPRHELGRHHDLLLANLLAQAEALAFGREAPGEPHRVCPGDRPSSTLLVDGPLTPAALGTLIALYEHKTLVEGVLWGIDSFDQWGVELGKVLATTIADELEGDAVPSPDAHDSSTNELLRRARVARGRAV